MLDPRPSGQSRRTVRTVAGLAAVLLAAATLTPGAAAQDPSPDFTGTALGIIAPPGEDGKQELGDWLAQQGISVSSRTTAEPDQIFTMLAMEGVDIATVPHGYVVPWARAGSLMPLDVCRLSNWRDVFPALREASSISDAGSIYAIPVVWGDTPFIYAPSRVSEPPTSIKALLKSKWARKYIVPDDPFTVLHLLAVARGYSSPDLTLKELAAVKKDAQKLLANAFSVSSDYNDVLDTLMSGSAILAIAGYEDMIGAAEAQGVTLASGFLKESQGGWTDAMAIPATAADVDAAYAYIDALLAPEANALLASDVFAGTVNQLSVPLLDPAAPPFDYGLVSVDDGSAAASACPGTSSGPGESPAAAESPGTSAPPTDQAAVGLRFDGSVPPAEAGKGKATQADWIDAWNEARGG
jgi:spermidine/putrescine transport system substrate-binding protein